MSALVDEDLDDDYFGVLLSDCPSCGWLADLSGETGRCLLCDTGATR